MLHACEVLKIFGPVPEICTRSPTPALLLPVAGDAVNLSDPSCAESFGLSTSDLNAASYDDEEDPRRLATVSLTATEDLSSWLACTPPVEVQVASLVKSQPIVVYVMTPSDASPADELLLDYLSDEKGINTTFVAVTALQSRDVQHCHWRVELWAADILDVNFTSIFPTKLTVNKIDIDVSTSCTDMFAGDFDDCPIQAPRSDKNHTNLFFVAANIGADPEAFLSCVNVSVQQACNTAHAACTVTHSDYAGRFGVYHVLVAANTSVQQLSTSYKCGSDGTAAYSTVREAIATAGSSAAIAVAIPDDCSAPLAALGSGTLSPFLLPSAEAQLIVVPTTQEDALIEVLASKPACGSAGGSIELRVPLAIWSSKPLSWLQNALSLLDPLPDKTLLTVPNAIKFVQTTENGNVTLDGLNGKGAYVKGQVSLADSNVVLFLREPAQRQLAGCLRAKKGDVADVLLDNAQDPEAPLVIVQAVSRTDLLAQLGHGWEVPCGEAEERLIFWNSATPSTAVSSSSADSTGGSTTSSSPTSSAATTSATTAAAGSTTPGGRIITFDDGSTAGGSFKGMSTLAAVGLVACFCGVVYAFRHTIMEKLGISGHRSHRIRSHSVYSRLNAVKGDD